MPRYKTVIAACCEKNHPRLVEDREYYNSVADAQESAIQKAKKQICPQCMSRTTKLTLIGNEVIPPPSYTVFGFHCDCKHRVEVFRMEDGVTHYPPPEYKGKCPNCGRDYSIPNNAILPSWREQPN